MAQMKATDVRNKISPYSGQNQSRVDVSFLAIYVLVTPGPVGPSTLGQHNCPNLWSEVRQPSCVVCSEFGRWTIFLRL